MPKLLLSSVLSFFLFAFTSVFLLVACSGTQIKAMSGAFATCAQADLGQQISIPSLAGDLLDVVTAIIEENTPTLEADLGAVAAIVGPAAIKCAIVVAGDVLTTRARVAVGSGSGSGSSASPSTASVFVHPGLDRARAFAAKLK